MVYRIRNKSFFNTFSGYKNNYHAKIISDPTPVKSFKTSLVKNFGQIHAFIRLNQAYRNISRTCKKYIGGNKELEETMIMGLRKLFHIPFTCQTPVELIVLGPEKRFTEHVERDYELVSANVHPYQLDFYHQNLKDFQAQAERLKLIDEGEKPLDIQFEEYVVSKLAELEAKNGKTTTKDLYEIFDHGKYMYEEALGAKHAKTRSGDFNDYLEHRRPFDSATANIPVQ